MLYQQLKQEYQELEAIIHKAQAEYDCSPKGNLRVSGTVNAPMYYVSGCDGPGKNNEEKRDSQGRYMGKANRNLIKALAQKQYAKRAIAIATKDCITLKNLMEKHPYCGIDGIKQLYEKMSPLRKELVTPYVVDDSSFVIQWQNEDFPSLEMQAGEVGLTTNCGETVRSKSELIIANKLAAAGIPYRYECRLQLSNTKVVFPDFTILDVSARKEVYWEHFGMMDDSGYADSAVRKIEQYILNGIFPGDRLMASFETSGHTLNTQVVDLMIAKLQHNDA